MTAAENRIPTLLLERDGYEILTVINIGWRGHTAWILLHKTARGYIEEAASGWGHGYHEQRRAAYEAMKQHKLDLAARDGAA